jgi:hypothetical protein
MARRLRVPFLIALLLCAAGLSHAVETFDYVVDFEADGNVNGPFDGVVDHVDEFDDATLAPWIIRRGTTHRNLRDAAMQSPGLAVNLPAVFKVPFEASAAGVENRLHVGDGDATLRLVLPAQAIGANDSLSFDLSTYEDSALYYTGIVLTNYNASMAQTFSPPFPVGLAVSAHFERLGVQRRRPASPARFGGHRRSRSSSYRRRHAVTWR